MIRLKNEREIEGIRKSCHLLADLFKEVIPQVKPGVTTKWLDERCKEFMLSHGGKPAWYREGFPGAACISINEEVIHGVPSAKKYVREGDMVSLDVGIDLDGYISDSCHTVLVGEVKPEWRKLHEITKECLKAGIRACKAGNRISDISAAVYEVAKAHKYGVVYDYCGHGVGIEVHEDPSIPNLPGPGPNPRIQSGMVLAIEPMINLGTADVYTDDTGWTVITADGKASCHEEHTLAVFKDHTEVLSDLNYK